jgi:penicillin-insensitive murein endopeptidase
MKFSWPVVVSMFAICMPCVADASTCYGTVSKGRLSKGVQLPPQGINFTAYSSTGAETGRTYVHDQVRQAVLEAYANVRTTLPDKTYVYGETGFAHGGPIPPHRTHQAGLSVDFMVPVLDDAGRSVPLPSSPSNKFGYAIDFEAMAEHLYQIAITSRRHGITIERVIFDRRLTERLFNSSRHGAELQRFLPFMKARPWIRHDEHYHIDFGLSCRPLRDYHG